MTKPPLVPPARDLSTTGFRFQLRSIGMALVAVVAFATAVALTDGDGGWTEPDKARHFAFGRWAAAIVFLAGYLTLLFRIHVLPAVALGRIVAWVPILGGLALALAALAALVAGGGKEVLDASTGGGGDPEDVSATLDGAAEILPAVGIVALASIVLLPLPVLLRVPGLAAADIAHGALTLESRLRRPDTLLVESDPVEATRTMRICRRRGRVVRWLNSTDDADHYLDRRRGRLVLVVADPFAGDGDGAGWLAALERRHPRGKRSFRLVVSCPAAAAESLGPARKLADRVLPLPWPADELRRFLDDHGLG